MFESSFCIKSILHEWSLHMKNIKQDFSKVNFDSNYCLFRTVQVRIVEFLQVYGTGYFEFFVLKHSSLSQIGTIFINISAIPV